MSEYRVGMGIDFHRFDPDRDLILGGVKIPHDRGLLGHSDADVLTHAICDALLGAAGLEDIGVHFPDTDERYRGISSLRLLEAVLKLIRARGFRPVNLDCTVIAEEPRLSPHAGSIRDSLARVLEVPSECVAVKATTTEGIGGLGRGEGMGSLSVVLIERDSQGPCT